MSTIVELAVITVEPVNITVNRSDLAIFNVTVMEISDEELTFQWQRGGSNLVETPGKFEGVNTSVLKIKEVRNEDEDSYECVIFNGAGDSVRSNKTFLSVGKLSHKWTVLSKK